jgi:hypothetical protein
VTETILFLKSTRFSIAALGQIEDDGMGMKLWRGIAIDWSGSVVFEARHGEPASGFCRVIAANSRLRELLQFIESDAYTLSMSFAHPIVATYQRGEGDGFRSRECRVPTCSMLHCFDGSPILIRVFMSRAVLNELLSALGMLALAQLGKVFGAYGTGQAQLRRQSTLPLALNCNAFRPAALLLGGELLLVIGLCSRGG